MLDPTPRISGNAGKRRVDRGGAIMPLFALLMPVLLIFAGFAVNLAYMQLVSTELKIATDAAAHAGGRAMSLKQSKDINESLETTIAQARLTAQANLVGGHVLSVGAEGDESQIQLSFGKSIRGNNGYGMYEFTEIPINQITSGQQRPSSLAVLGNIELPMAFGMLKMNHGAPVQGGLSSFNPFRRSIATQVDRDIALVLDRSGSMLYYRDEVGLEDTLADLYNSWVETTVPGYTKYHYWKWSNYSHSWSNKGYWKPEDASGSWQIRDPSDTQWQGPTTTSSRRISWSEYQDATAYLYDRRYSNNVIFQLEAWTNTGHTLGNTYSSSENGQLTNEMAKYCHDWKYVNGAPRFSRWWYLEQGVQAFLDVLDTTDQEELVSLVTFASTATLDLSLQDTYSQVRSMVEDINPYGGTAIGDGMTTGLPPIVNGEAARPFAAKTIVVLTDGENNNGQDPGAAVAEIMGQYAVTIHTVTFTLGADQAAMKAVAEAGHGRHYHADDGTALISIFEEIANNLPTILTE
jgi:uncharacterized protein YegL